MKLAYTRLVTDRMAELSAFYERLLGTPPHGAGDYVEFRPGGATLALVSTRACASLHGGSWQGGENRSAILEFAVDDVDRERERIADFVANGTLNVELRLPLSRSDLLARIHRDGTVVQLDYEEEVAHVFASIPKRALETYKPFCVVPGVV